MKQNKPKKPTPAKAAQDAQKPSPKPHPRGASGEPAPAWTPSAAAYSESTLRHLIYAAAAAAPENSSGGPGGSGGPAPGIIVTKNWVSNTTRPNMMMAVTKERPIGPVVTPPSGFKKPDKLVGPNERPSKVYLIVATGAKRGWDYRGLLTVEPNNLQIAVEKIPALFRIFEITRTADGKLAVSSIETGPHGHSIYSQWRPTSYPGDLNGFGFGNAFGVSADQPGTANVAFYLWAAYGFDDNYQLKWDGTSPTYAPGSFSMPVNNWKGTGKVVNPSESLPPNGDDSGIASLSLTLRAEP